MTEYVVTACASFTCGSFITWFMRNKIQRIVALSPHFYKGQPKAKMVIVARTDLPITPGKLAAQCAHAAVSCYSMVKKTNPEVADLWVALGQPKIIVKCGSESALVKLAHEAKGSKIISAIIADAGRTQVKSGTKTVIGIGPASEEDIDKITGNLKLL